jgi:hypothetical protein
MRDKRAGRLCAYLLYLNLAALHGHEWQAERFAHCIRFSKADCSG